MKRVLNILWYDIIPIFVKVMVFWILPIYGSVSIIRLYVEHIDSCHYTTDLKFEDVRICAPASDKVDCFQTLGYEYVCDK